jgi:hypothetical protein
MSKKNWTIWGTAFLFTVIGTYNSVVIDSKSVLDNAHHSLVKRLDHEGINRPARMVASTVKWQKLRPLAPQKQVAIIRENESAPVQNNIAVEAVVSEDLNLVLVEVINPEKFKDGLASTDFSGMLTTNGGQIETLEVSLPEGLGVSVSYSEISGNVFEYESNGETQSGMVYQVDQNAYMVSFTAGAMAGTRLRFQAAEVIQTDTQDTELAEASSDVGQFGQEGYDAEQMANLDRDLQKQALDEGFKF